MCTLFIEITFSGSMLKKSFHRLNFRQGFYGKPTPPTPAAKAGTSCHRLPVIKANIRSLYSSMGLDDTRRWFVSKMNHIYIYLLEFSIHVRFWEKRNYHLDWFIFRIVNISCFGRRSRHLWVGWFLSMAIQIMKERTSHVISWPFFHGTS